MNDLINRICELGIMEANAVIRAACGIVNYFSTPEEKDDFTLKYKNDSNIACEDRASYGDWQTPEPLAYNICKKHLQYYGNPDVVIEPTCGLGVFILAAIEVFSDLKEIYGIDINPRYTQALKFRILTNAINKPKQSSYPDIYIYTINFFEFNFSSIFDKIRWNNWKLAIIGNPPWVTNSRQGMHGSKNIPVKHNLYGLKGIDAITGKSNFDISEYITLELLGLATNLDGAISFLLKNSVIRNIVIKQKSYPRRIGNIKQESIDAAKEFNVSVGASCLSARLGCNPDSICEYKDLYSGIHKLNYGWINNSFVADIESYGAYSRFDGASTFIWRSGIKHDCSKILELEKIGAQYVNGLGEIVTIEDGIIYPLIKSSDVNKEDCSFNRFIIVPQHRVGENTSSLKLLYPLAYKYLESHEDFFNNRRSSIYKDKDKFSVFGIGDYTFKPYKIVISSLYKKIHFRLLTPVGHKPVVVDDTCYQLGFENLNDAKTILAALRSHEIQQLLKSLIFPDAKRVVTKALLMRIDLDKYCREKSLSLSQDTMQLDLF